MVANSETMQKLDIDFAVRRLAVHSPYGEELRRSIPIHTSSERNTIEKKLDLLESAISLYERKSREFSKIDAVMCDFNQLRGTAKRLREGARLSVIELHELKTFAINLGRLSQLLEELHWEKEIGCFMPRNLECVVEILDPSGEGTGTFHIYSAYSEELRSIRDRMAFLQKKHISAAQPILRQLEEEGYSIAQGVVRVKKNDEMAKRRADADPRLVFRASSPTMHSYYVAEAKEIEDELESLRSREGEEEDRVRGELSDALRRHVQDLEWNFCAIGEIDLLIAKARFSIGFGLVRPELGNVCKLRGAFHLKVRHNLKKQGKDFTPIDIELDSKISIITGANMGGKTVSIKLVGQCVLLAQMGFFVPCESAVIELFDHIFISVGDDQDIDLGLSTFGSEMMKIIGVLEADYSSALVLIDELARGTNPSEGAALSIALVEHLQELNVRAVITTHFDGLTLVPGVAHYQVVGLENADLSGAAFALNADALELHRFMDYRLRKSDVSKEIPKEAIRISEMLGLNKKVVCRARQVLDEKRADFKQK